MLAFVRWRANTLVVPYSDVPVLSPEKIAETANFGKIDLVLLDANMQVMDGYEATNQIRNLEARVNIHTPIIATYHITSYNAQQDQPKLKEARMDSYILKPCGASTLKRIALQYAKGRVFPSLYVLIIFIGPCNARNCPCGEK